MMGESETRRVIQSFYNSKRWKSCQRAYKGLRGGLCENCLSRGLIVPGVHVHHRKHLTAETVNNPEIALSFDNLILLCAECHMEAHNRKRQRRTDESGHVTL